MADEPNLLGGLAGHPREVPGAFRQVSGGSDPTSGHETLVQQLGQLHTKYRTIVEDLGQIKEELVAIGKIDLGTGSGGGNRAIPMSSAGKVNNPRAPQQGEGPQRAVPETSSSSGTSTTPSGEPARAVPREQAKVPVIGGGGGGEGPEGQTSQQGGGSNRWRTAGYIAGGAATGLAVAGGFYNRQVETHMIRDLAQSNMQLGGLGMDQSTAMMRRMMSQHGGNSRQYASAAMAMQGQGIIAGTGTSNVTLGGAAQMRAQVAPDMEMSDLASILGSLNVGEPATRLAQMGIRTQLNQDPQQLMRSAVQRVFGGQPTAQQLRLIAPGTTQYTMLSQMLGGEQTANLAIRQELNRATGQPVSKSALAEDIRRREGSEGIREMEWGPEMRDAISTQVGIQEDIQQKMTQIPPLLQSISTQIGAFGSGLNGLIGGMQNLVINLLALRGAGLFKGGDGALSRGASKVGGALGGAARWVGRGLGRGGGAVGRAVVATAGAAATGASGLGKIPGIGPWFTPIGQGGYIAPEDIPLELRQQYGLDEGEGEIGAGIGDSGGGGGGSLLLQRTSKESSHVTGMHPDLRRRLEAMFAANPRLRLNSGYRSPAHQQRLWEEALKKYGSAEAARKWVAPPGRSNHEKGLAADIGPSSEYEWLKRNAPQFGLEPYAPEPWHWELQGTRSGQHTDWSPSGGGGGGGIVGAAMAQGKSIGGDGAFASPLNTMSQSSAQSIMAALGGGIPSEAGGVASLGAGGAGGGGAGGAVQGELGTFLAAIRRLESGSFGGKYDARGPRITNPKSQYYGEQAYGAYQIMPGNWASWSQAAGVGGANISDPAAQDQVAGHMLSKYKQQYGSWEAAAVAWFAGGNAAAQFSAGANLSGTADVTGTNVPEYVSLIQQYMKEYAQIGAGVGDRGSSSTSVSTPPSPSFAGGGMRAPMAGPQSVTIQVMFNEATDEHAARFARKVSAVLKGEDRIERIGAS